MTIKLSSNVVDSFVSNCKCFSGKIVVLVNDSFDFSQIEKSLSYGFPQNLKSVTTGNMVLSFFVMPEINQDHSTAYAHGPISMINIKNGKVGGFIIFDGDLTDNSHYTDENVLDKVLLCSDSICEVGDTGILTIQNLDVKLGTKNIFYSFNLSMMGI